MELVRLVLKAISYQMDIVSLALSTQSTIQLLRAVFVQMASLLINGESAHANAEPMRNTMLLPKFVHAFLD